MSRSAPTDLWLSGHVLDRLRELEAGSVACSVTSPPYWGLRAYSGDQAVDWPEIAFSPMAGLPPLVVTAGRAPLGLEADPWAYVAHMILVFRELRRVLRADGTLWLNLGDCYATGAGRVGDHPGGGEQGSRWAGDVERLRDEKRGYRGERLANGRGDCAAILRQKTRADRDGSHAGKHAPSLAGIGPMTQPNRLPIAGLKPKDLVGMPWRVALALQADGWWLRADCVWAKPNPMPSSRRDCPTISHEYVFLLAASERYYYDDVAVREPCVAGDVSGDGPDYEPPGGGPPHRGLRRRAGNKARVLSGGAVGLPTAPHLGRGVPWVDDGSGRTRRSVWSIPTNPYRGAHFATFPPALAEVGVLAGSSARGACPDCGAGWERVVDRIFEPASDVSEERGVRGALGQKPMDPSNGWQGVPRGSTSTRTLGWEPGCECYGMPPLPVCPPPPEGPEPTPEDLDAWRRVSEPIRAERARLVAELAALPAVPCRVLDPFGGAGTTALVSRRHGRRFVYVDLSEDYQRLARERLDGEVYQISIFGPGMALHDEVAPSTSFDLQSEEPRP